MQPPAAVPRAVDKQLIIKSSEVKRAVEWAQVSARLRNGTRAGNLLFCMGSLEESFWDHMIGINMLYALARKLMYLVSDKGFRRSN